MCIVDVMLFSNCDKDYSPWPTEKKKKKKTQPIKICMFMRFKLMIEKLHSN